MWFPLCGDRQSPSNSPLGRCVLGVVVRRKRPGGLGDDLGSASAASIDAGMVGHFSGIVLLVERRAEADFYVIAAPEARHGSPLLGSQTATVQSAKGGDALCRGSGICLEERWKGRGEIVQRISTPSAWKIPNARPGRILKGIRKRWVAGLFPTRVFRCLVGTHAKRRDHDFIL